jgi:tetratricopeptide (TPR) repeat protein
MTPVNQGVASSNNHAEMDSIKSINETPSGENSPESGNTFSGYENRTEIQSELHHAIIWNNKGVVLSKMGLFAQSIEAFDRAIQLYPEYCNAWNNKGVALSRLGQYEKSIEAYDRALQINLDHPSSYQNQEVFSPGIVTST